MIYTLTLWPNRGFGPLGGLVVVVVVVVSSFQGGDITLAEAKKSHFKKVHRIRKKRERTERQGNSRGEANKQTNKAGLGGGRGTCEFFICGF
jgi:hypothetical protein